MIPDRFGGERINGIIADADTTTMIQVILAAMVIVALVRLAISLLQAYLFGKVGASMVFDVRNQLFDHLQVLSLKFYQRRETGELMSRILNDVTTIQSMLTSTFLSFITNVVAVIIFLTAILKLNWKLSRSRLPSTGW